MKRCIAHLLTHWPALYRFVARIYWTLRIEHILELQMGTKVRERWWARRSIAEGYWQNRDLPSKHFLAEKIAAFSPGSVLEVGCASGPNLHPLAKKFPQTQIVGIDINQEAIDFGRAQFAREGMSNVKLSVGKADEMGEFQDGDFEVVFTNALLIYIGPDKIMEVLKGLLRVARRALVLMELHFFESNKKDPFGLGVYHYGNWVRDYVALLKQFVPEGQIRVTKIPEAVLPEEPWKEFGAVIEVVR